MQGSFQGTAAAFQDSLKNEPWLILAALLSVYLVLGILYESLIHPLTIISTLPSAGVGAMLALLIFHTDLSVIAIIGVILLIGIVKKNAIMMIDFALDAGAQPRQEQRRRHLRGVYSALPSDHDDHDVSHAGRGAAGAGNRHGVRAAEAAGYCDCRRADIQPVADAVYDTGSVSVPG